MKLFLCLLAVLAIAAPVARTSPLEHEMKTIGAKVKALSKQIADKTQKESSLQLVAAIKSAAEKSKTLAPSKSKDIAQAERDAFMADYRKQLDRFGAELAKIETALKGDNFAQAETLFNGLKEIKREGHEKFAAED